MSKSKPIFQFSLLPTPQNISSIGLSLGISNTSLKRKCSFTESNARRASRQKTEYPDSNILPNEVYNGDQGYLTSILRTLEDRISLLEEKNRKTVIRDLELGGGEIVDLQNLREAVLDHQKDTGKRMNDLKQARVEAEDEIQTALNRTGEKEVEDQRTRNAVLDSLGTSFQKMSVDHHRERFQCR